MGDEAEFEGHMLEVTLGPGMLSRNYDGLQNDSIRWKAFSLSLVQPVFYRRKRRMSSDFTKGNIMKSLLGFMAPVLGALFLQAMYGAVDLLVVGSLVRRWMCPRWERVLRL